MCDVRGRGVERNRMVNDDEKETLRLKESVCLFAWGCVVACVDVGG